MDTERSSQTFKPAILCLVACLVGGSGCASQVAPSGGPQDTDPPRIVASSPGSGALDVQERSIHLEFSEYVDRRSFQESAYLSPSPGELQFEWGGRDVTISFTGSLSPQTTYILSVGTDLKDTRNNQMASTFILPFSTGGTIDSCSAEGRVHDPTPGGVMVFAYDVSGGRGDTLNPGVVKPSYLTQTGTDGRYTLRNMKEGTYRLIAVRDVFRDLLYNVQTDRYAMAPTDVSFGADRRSVVGIDFRLTAEDTLRPFISAIRARDRTSILVRFNEALTSPDGPGFAAVSDTLGGGALTVFDFAPTDTSFREYHVTTSRQEPGVGYRLVLNPFTDSRGNLSDSAGRIGFFAGALALDTVPPVVQASVGRDSLTGVSPHDTLRFSFSEPVDSTAFSAGLRIIGPGQTPLPGRLSWTGVMLAAFHPGHSPVPGAWYELSVRLDSVRDRNGNVTRDSILLRHFRIAEEKSFGSIAGVIGAGEGDGGARPSGLPQGTIIVEAAGVMGSGARSLTVAADSGNRFFLDRLPEGRYVLRAYVDLNGNGSYDSGVPFPLRFAEPFGTYADTLKVRPRWPIEGVRIAIGK